jgi:hypothetical protein
MIKLLFIVEDLKKSATTILSASMDKSMVLWTFDENQKMYIDKVRLFLIE